MRYLSDFARRKFSRKVVTILVVCVLLFYGLTSPINWASTWQSFVSPISPIDTPQTLESPLSMVSPVSPIAAPALRAPVSSDLIPPSDLFLWCLYAIGGIAVLIVIVLMSKQAVTSARTMADPNYLYRLLYAQSNHVKKRLLLFLLARLNFSKRPLETASVNVVKTYASFFYALGDPTHTLEDWIEVLRTRESLVPSELGSSLLNLDLMLQLAMRKRTLMQIAELVFDVDEDAGGTLNARVQGYGTSLDVSITDSFKSDLMVLAKISRAIRAYIAKVVENRAIDSLEATIDSIRAIEITGDSRAPEEFVIRQIVTRWGDIGQAEIARNPYIAGRPVTEPDLFFGRDSEMRQIIGVAPERHVAIWGQRRIGKTSILHQLKGYLLRQPEVQYRMFPVFINVEPLTELESSRLFHELILSTLNSLAQFSIDPTLLLLHEQRVKSAVEYDLADVEHDLYQIFERLQFDLPGFQVRLVWLVDEVDKLLERQPSIQLQLKTLACSELLRSKLILIFAGLSHPVDLVDEAVKSFYASFYSVRLHSLSPEDARRLVTEPVKGNFVFEEEAIDLIIKQCNYEPYWIQLLCREALWIALGQRRNEVMLQDVEAARKYLPEHSPAYGG